jgi:hypothetical protein
LVVLLHSQWGVLGLCTVGANLLAPAEWVATHWRTWGSSSWTGESWISWREVQCEALSFCVLRGNRASSATCRVAGYNFPPVSGESGILTL